MQTKKVRLIWRVCPAPTGRLRAFEERGWPEASYADGTPAALIECDFGYTPALAKAEGLSLVVEVRDHSVSPLLWRTVKCRAGSLAEAKRLAAETLERFPHMAHQLEKCDG